MISAPRQQIIEAAVRHLGPHAPAGVLALLAALTGFTPRPVRLSLSGNIQLQLEVVRYIERLIPRSYCRFLSSVTEAGLQSLDSEMAALCCLVYWAPDLDANVRKTVELIAQSIPVRALDGSHTGSVRLRESNPQLAQILIDREHESADLDVVLNLTAASDRWAVTQIGSAHPTPNYIEPEVLNALHTSRRNAMTIPSVIREGFPACCSARSRAASPWPVPAGPWAGC